MFHATRPQAALAALFVAAGLAGPALAQEDEPATPPEARAVPGEAEAAPDLAAQCEAARERSEARIKAADVDDDGDINAEEFANWREASFALTDENGDGRITAEEHAVSWIGPEPARGILRTECARAEEHVQFQKALRFRVMDGNGDGAVSMMEYMRMGDLVFSEADGNNDGRVTRYEFRQRLRGM